MSICTLNDVSFYNDDRGGIPIASRIRVKDPDTMRFLNPIDNQKKQLFSEYEQVGKDITALKTNLGYFYTLTYALKKVATTKIKLLTEDDEKEEKKEEKPVVKEKDPKEVTDAVKKFKLDNNKNEDLYKTSYSVYPATQYSGKLGDAILIDSGFNDLSIEDLNSIVQVAGRENSSTSSLIKECDNPWRSTRVTATKFGKHEEAMVRLNMLLKLGKIGQEELEQEIMLVDNPPKRTYNRSEKPAVEKIKYDSLTDNALNAADMFNMLFCLDAINKDNLFYKIG